MIHSVLSRLISLWLINSFFTNINGFFFCKVISELHILRFSWSQLKFYGCVGANIYRESG